MLKKLITLFSIFVAVAVFSQDEKTVDKISVPGPVDFSGTEFFLDWVNHPSKTLFTQQYLPKDEKIENFNQLFSFMFFNKDLDMEEAAKQKVESIQDREKDDKYSFVNVTESPDGKELIVDFLITENKNSDVAFAEYTIYRYKKYEAENKPLLIVGYTKRMYGDIKSSAKVLSKERSKLLTAMIDYKIPNIKIVEELKPEVKKEETKESSKTAETKPAETKKEEPKTAVTKKGASTKSKTKK